MQKITNWSEYNKSLQGRGSITLWFSDEAIKAWTDWKRPEASKKGGRKGTYGDAAILCALTIRAVFNLPLRQTRGFIKSLIQVLKIDLPVPCFTTISNRSKTLEVTLPTARKSGKIDLVIDSTGLKVYGEGEWKVRTHGKSKRRVWRKMHLAVDPKNHEIVVCELTESGCHDAPAAASMLADLDEKVGRVYADGAYDNESARGAIAAAGARAVIPPRSGAALHSKKSKRPLRPEREAAIRSRWKTGDLKEWKRRERYHTRSLAETAMGRFKGILGGTIRSRTFESQATEVFVKAGILNRMCAQGMPKRE